MRSRSKVTWTSQRRRYWSVHVEMRLKLKRTLTTTEDLLPDSLVPVYFLGLFHCSKSWAECIQYLLQNPASTASLSYQRHGLQVHHIYLLLDIHPPPPSDCQQHDKYAYFYPVASGL